MSDMEQSDVNAAPAAEPTAPVEGEGKVAPETVIVETPAPEPVPVVAQQPSSASPTQAPEAAPAAEEPLSLKDAVDVLLIYIRAHRTAGDVDLEAAIADVEAALAAQA